MARQYGRPEPRALRKESSRFSTNNGKDAHPNRRNGHRHRKDCNCIFS